VRILNQDAANMPTPAKPVTALVPKRLWCRHPNPMQNHFCPDGHPFGASRGCKASEEPYCYAGHVQMGGWCRGHAPVNIQLADQALRQYSDAANELFNTERSPYDFAKRGPNYSRAQNAYIQYHGGIFSDYDLVANVRPHTDENRKQFSKPSRRQRGLAYSQVTSDQAGQHRESKNGDWHQPRGHGKTGSRHQGNHSRSSSVGSRSGSPARASSSTMQPPPPPAGYVAVEQPPPPPPTETQPELFAQIETAMDRRLQLFMDRVFAQLPVNNGISDSSTSAENFNESNGRLINTAVINIQPISTVSCTQSGSAPEATVMPLSSSDVEMDGS